jgi:hypothetical protein
MMDAITKAYQAENLTGSYCTAPLRAYNNWFQNKIQTNNGACERTAWKVCYVVSAIFAYLTLGVLAVVGIAINLCLIPPENGYSVWARLNGIPGATEKFCEELRWELSFACRTRAEVVSGSASSSDDRYRCYTYNLNKVLSFDIQDVFENDPFIWQNAQIIGEVEDGGEAIRLQQDEDPSQAHLRRMEPHIAYIQNVVQALSRKHSWYPENQSVRTVNDRVAVMIPLPDHLPIPNFN